MYAVVVTSDLRFPNARVVRVGIDFLFGRIEGGLIKVLWRDKSVVEG